jgi:hypothetical protein
MSVVINGSAGVTTNSGAVYDSLQRGTALTAVTNFTTSADFTSIPSWVKRITVMFQGISLSGTDSILIQIGDSGGLETTGYISTSTGFTGGSGSTSNNTTGFVILSDSAAYLISGIVVITNISGNTWVESGSGKLSTAASWVCGGDKTLSATLDRVSVTRTGTNTFDAGTINILYE